MDELNIKELHQLTHSETEDLKKLLIEYGKYMYEELGLIAGKESYNEQTRAFPSSHYKLPDGTFFIAYIQNKPAGCVGIRRFDDISCEMKRMYVNPGFRGYGLGDKLCKLIIQKAKTLGYKKMLLDTNKEMGSAVKVYINNGFKVIPAYCINENDHPIYMEIHL